MAVGPIITLGYGNITDASAADVITLGFMSSALVTVGGPFCVEASAVFLAGSEASQVFADNVAAKQQHSAGSVASEVGCQ